MMLKNYAEFAPPTRLARTAALVASTVAVVIIARAGARDVGVADPVQRRATSDAAAAYPGYKLVWSDEFDRDGPPDPANWTYERGFVRNQELQWYQPDNARVENGLLIIEARRERKPNPELRGRRSRLEAQPRVRRVHLREPHDPRPAQLAVRPLRDARAHRHAARACGRPSGRSARAAAGRAAARSTSWSTTAAMLLANAAWGGREQRGRRSGTTRANPSPNSATRIGPRSSTSGGWTGTRTYQALRGRSAAQRRRPDEDRQRGRHRQATPSASRTTSSQPRHRRHLGGDPSGTEFPARYEVDYIRVYQR